MPALAEFQDRFFSALMRTSGHAPDFAAGPRFQIYRNTVVKGLIDVLQANYPTVERLVGAEWFQSAARAYALGHLPKEAPLSLYGVEFPTFLHGFEPAAALPYLPQVAQLDRWWTEAHFAADAPCLAATELASLQAEILGSLQLQFHPAARLGICKHSAVTIWRCNRPPAAPPDSLEVDGGDEAVLIARPHGAIEVLPLTPAEWIFVSQLHAGATLNDAAMHALEFDSQTNIANLLAQLIRVGAFASLSTKETKA